MIERWARVAGLEAERLEEMPGRPSVLARARGTGGGRTLLLCGHIDTVNVEGMTYPHTPRIDGDRLYGRGAYDMKAGGAAPLLAAREASRAGLAGDVVVAAVADEEHASVGIREALRRISADAAVATEPTELKLAVAHKGFVWSEIEVTGRSAHGSRPHLGVDAIVKMGGVLNGLERPDKSLGERTHPLLGRASVHASLIEVSHDVLLVREPFEIDEGEELVALVRQATAEALGQPAPIAGASYWADAAFIAAAGIPTVLFGPGGEGAHAVEEWVSLAGTEAVVRTLVRLAARFCA